MALCQCGCHESRAPKEYRHVQRTVRIKITELFSYCLTTLCDTGNAVLSADLQKMVTRDESDKQRHKVHGFAMWDPRPTGRQVIYSATGPALAKDCPAAYTYVHKYAF